MSVSVRSVAPAGSTARVIAVGALLVSAVCIVVQIAGGATDYPTVPPGAVILAVAALVTALRRPWWTPAIGAVVALFLCVGGALAPNTAMHLADPRILVSGGTLVQLVAMPVAFVAGVWSLVAFYRAARS